MSDSLSISNYGMNNLYNDPYFQQYFVTSQYADSLNAQQNALSAISATPKTATTTSNPTFNGTIPRATESSGSGSGLAAGLLAAGTIAVGTACWFASKGKAAGGSWWNKVCAGAKSCFSKGGEAGIITFTEKNGKKVCNIPNRINRIHGENAATAMENIGCKAGTNVPNVLKGDKLAEGIGLRRVRFELDGNTFVYDIANNRFVSYRNSSGENLLSKITNPIEQNDIAYKQTVEEFIKGIKDGSKLNDSAVKWYRYTHNSDGVLRCFTHNAGTNTDRFSGAISHNFNIADDVVCAQRLNDKVLDAALKSFSEGKVDKAGRIVSAEYPVKLGGKQYRFIIENNDKIIGLKDNAGRLVDQTTYDALHYQNQDVFSKIFENKNKFEKLVFAAA